MKKAISTVLLGFILVLFSVSIVSAAPTYDHDAYIQQHCLGWGDSGGVFVNAGTGDCFIIPPQAWSILKNSQLVPVDQDPMITEIVLNAQQGGDWYFIQADQYDQLRDKLISDVTGH